MRTSILSAGTIGLVLVVLAGAGFAQRPDLRGQQIAFGGGPQGAGSACVTCHGPRGQGEAGAGFPRLAGLDARYLAKQLADYASGARPNEVMRPIAQALSDDDRQAVALYYAEMPPIAAEPLGQPDPRRLQLGASVYAQGSAVLDVQACQNCHGPAGRGLGAVYPSIAGQPAAYTHAQLQAWRDGVRRNDIHGVMASIVQKLDEDTIVGLADYLARTTP